MLDELKCHFVVHFNSSRVETKDACWNSFGCESSWAGCWRTNGVLDLSFRQKRGCGGNILSKCIHEIRIRIIKNAE